MVEREPAGPPFVLEYEGYFDAKEVDYHIDNYLRERGYDKHDLKHDEQVLPEGRQIYIHKEPYKNLTHYAKHLTVVDINIDHLKRVKVNGKELDEGHIVITFSPFIHMDWMHRWTAKPIFWFLARYMDKVYYKYYTKTVIKGVVDDAKYVYQQMQILLNAKW